MTGNSKLATMRLMARIGTFEILLLVDSSFFHNFINTDIITKVGRHMITIEQYIVRVVSGEKLHCQEVV